MEIKNDVPEKGKLYKYRKFNEFSLDLLISSRFHYSEPEKLNDPLDCEVDFKLDSLPELEAAYIELTTKEYGPKKAEEYLQNTKRSFLELDYDVFLMDFNEFRFESREHAYWKDLALKIYKNLFIQEAKILSLSESSTDILLWTHYADEHRGLCLEYTADRSVFRNLHKVRYNESRYIGTSELIMCIFDESKRQYLLDSFLTRKAKRWKYEEEWRDLKFDNSTSSPAELTGVYFGFRCPGCVYTTVRELFSGLKSDIKFYRMELPMDGDELEALPVETEYWIGLDVYDHQDAIDHGF